MLISMDARKRRFARVEKQPEPGDNLVLTIDEKIQYIVERELEKAMEDTHAEAGDGGGAESAHGRDSGAGESADVQSRTLAND